MLLVNVVKTNYYTYELTQEEEIAVRRIIEENEDGEFEYGPADHKIAKAFAWLRSSKKGTSLYENGKIVESDFQIEDFSYSEDNEQDADEWLYLGEINGRTS